MALTRGGYLLGLESLMSAPRFPSLLDIVNDKVAYKAKPTDAQLVTIKAVETAIATGGDRIRERIGASDIKGASDAVVDLGRELAAIFPDATPQTTIIGTDLHRLRLMATRAAGAPSPVDSAGNFYCDADQQIRLLLLDCLIAVFA